MYVAFDILYVEDQAVVKKPLEERHQLLRAAIDAQAPRGARAACLAWPADGCFLRCCGCCCTAVGRDGQGLAPAGGLTGAASLELLCVLQQMNTGCACQPVSLRATWGRGEQVSGGCHLPCAQVWRRLIHAVSEVRVHVTSWQSLSSCQAWT